LKPRTSTFPWNVVEKEGRFSASDYPIVRNVIVTAALCDGIAVETPWPWQHGQTTAAAFRVPLDRARIIECTSPEEFVAYRAKTPLLLVHLQQRWTRELTPDRRYAIRTIYDGFAKNREWPHSRTLEAKLLSAGRKGLSEIGRDINLFVSGNPQTATDRAKLTLTGLLHAEGSEDDQNLVVTLLRAAGQMAKAQPQLREVQLIELATAVGVPNDRTLILSFAKLVDSEPEAYFSRTGHDAEDFWISLSPRLIPLSNAERLEDVLLHSYKLEIGRSVDLLQWRSPTQELPPSETPRLPLRIPLTVNRRPAMLVLVYLGEEIDGWPEARHVWQTEVHTQTTYVGFWGISRELLSIIGPSTTEWSLTFGLVATIRRFVRQNLRRWSAQMLVGGKDEIHFRPVDPLDLPAQVERDVEVTLFDIAWNNLAGTLERVEKEGGSLIELTLSPADEWTRNETALRKVHAYETLREFYECYSELYRNRSFMPADAVQLRSLVLRLQGLGHEALNAFWDVPAGRDPAGEFWQMVQRLSPSLPDGARIPWNARITDLTVLAGVEGLALRAIDIVQLLRRGAPPGEFPWSIRVEDDSVVFAPSEVALTTNRDRIQEHIQIDSMELMSIRNIAGAKLDLSASHEPIRTSHSQCVTIIGDNASGKTTLLQMLALALLDGDAASSVVSRVSADAPIIRNTYKSGKSTVTVGAVRREIEVYMRDGVEYVRGAAGQFCDVYAYGSHRAVGARSSEMSFAPAEAVASLFDPRARLLAADVWLLQAQNAKLKNGGADSRFFDAVIELLKKLLPGVDSVEVGSRVVLSGPSIGTAPLTGMSGGYMTMASWVLDFLARASAAARRSGKEVDASFFEELGGILLIDEVDLHLHPQWQRKVIGDLRAVFPSLTMVMTTHSPMVAVTTAPHDVFVISREQARFELRRAEVPRGTDANKMLLDWFGLVSTTDPETTILLDRYRRLLHDRRSSDRAELSAVEETLRDRFVGFAATPIERIALQEAAKVADLDVAALEAMPLEARQRLAKQISDAVQARLASERKK
jgi:energy-coupling factor transporter ATP-binding protein EcfA2